MKKDFFSNFVRNAAVGAIASVSPAATKKLDVVVEKEIVLERHQFQESLDLLNRMRKAGGVRLVERGSGDNGAPKGHLPENILRHTNFGGLSERMNTEGYDFDDSAVPRSVPQAPVAPGLSTERMSRTPRHVATLQEDLHKFI